jgi:hypothetical protein
MIIRRIIAITLFHFLLYSVAPAQKITISGFVADANNAPLQFVSVLIPSIQLGTTTNDKGYFELEAEITGTFDIVFTSIGYEKFTLSYHADTAINLSFNILLKPSLTPIDELIITERSRREGTLTRIDFRSIDFFPGVSRNIESLIKTMPGVSSRNEFSSQYSVRGGNFDENLVYINGIEIYRPFLIRSGQQEGLSIINPDMVASVSFSAGGFDARFGDKMSSVLDIRYRKPEGFAGSASASLLGGNVHFEGTSRDRRFTHISSFRYKTNAYILGSLETRGEYNPSFSDFQTFLTWKFSEKTELSFIGNYSENKYNFIPETRETSFGTYQNSYGLTIYFDGQELNKFQTMFGALSLENKPSEKTLLTFTGSAYRTSESETFDILGQYLINQLDNQLGSTTYGDSIMNIGIGAFLNHARNYLDATVLNISHRGNTRIGSGVFEWGTSLNYEAFDNQMNEWKLIDSAGYSIPFDDNTVVLNDIIRSDYLLDNFRVSGFVQHAGKIYTRSSLLEITGGIRTMYLTQTESWYFSPRAGITFSPSRNNNLRYFFSTGIYYQPAFFKEMRDFYGNLNSSVLPQKTVHFVLGADYQFWWWNRPFKFASELYYKKLTDIIPYVTDNVRILYAGDNYSEGYAAGLDFKINGEFVRGLESWASLSLMQTREKISDKFSGNTPFNEIYPGEYIARPTDQLINFALFFQDFLPANPNYKVHVQLAYASRLPFHPPEKENYGSIFRMPSYKRVDIGFSRELTSLDKGNTGLNRYFKNLWLGVEIFNLLDIQNTASFLWFNSVAAVEEVPVNMAVPNYLSGRLLNVKLSARF